MEAAVPRKHWFDYVLTGARTLWFVSGVCYIVNNRDDYAVIPWLVLLLPYALAYAVPMALFLSAKAPRALAVMAELALSGGFFCIVEAYGDGQFNFYNFSSVMLGYMSAGRTAFFSAVVTIVAIPALTARDIGTGASTAIELGVLFGSGFCFQKLIRSFRQIERMYGMIENQNRALEVYGKQIEALALEQERSRLSRELHDTVGHTLTTAITGMDAVSRLIDDKPGEAKASLSELLLATRSGLDEVRRHIHQIAPVGGERSLAVGLSRAADRFGAHTGIRVRFIIEGDEYDVSEQIRLTALRCVQEALTNAGKHGNASAVNIALAYSADSVRIRIADDGKGVDPLIEGFGLKAMSERIANLNGALTIDSHPENGTVIVCTLPTNRPRLSGYS
ncbi:sensor histidine kinase [Paenibacillus sp. GYB003]|uniref:sensor histidine kinase n=1 Tax=Paenibacillus sp. GYB003 TaxID=2994392 RepID=UPI002F961D7E